MQGGQEPEVGQLKKRGREEMEKVKSELRLAMEELCLSSSGEEEEEQQQQQEKRSSTLDLLLSVSKQLIHVLDEIGPTLLVLRQDIKQNAERLQALHSKDPSKYSSLTSIVTDEVDQAASKKANSCTRAIVWLARCIDFSKHLLERLLKSPELSLEEVVEEAYRSTLKPWHGWISSAAYKVALKLVPARDTFVALLMGKCQNFEEFAGDAREFILMVQPLLDEINAILVKYKLDKLKSN